MTAAAPDLPASASFDRSPSPPSPAPSASDPHAPKLSPDDPRLRLRRPVARTLRAGPMVALLACLLGAVMLAIAFAFQAPSASSKGQTDPSGTPPPPAIPEAIRNAPAAPPSGAQRDAGTPRAEMAGRAGPAPEDPERRFEREQDLKARGADILFSAQGGPEGAPSEPPHPASPPAIPPNAATPLGASEGEGEDPNLQDRKTAFLQGKSSNGSDYVTASLKRPRSPYELQAGTIIPAVLITAINSDLPGPVLAQVRENVYDSVSGNFLLVPQGSRLVAHYDSRVAWGQERVLLCWNRLLLPNGDSMDLQCMPAADLKGAAGLTDQVDEHWFRILKGAAVASLLAATAQAVAGNTEGFSPTVPQTWARNTAGEVNQVGQQLTRRNLAIQPTITVRPGFSVNVIVTKDMVVPPYPDPPSALGFRP